MKTSHKGSLYSMNKRDLLTRMICPEGNSEGVYTDGLTGQQEQGCTEFASDCELTNADSQGFHQAVGFEEANRIVAYVRKI